MTSTGAAATCGLLVEDQSGVINVEASGTDANAWCSGEVHRSQGTATLEAPAVGTPQCDFWIGAVHVTVSAVSGSGAQGFCTAVGTFPQQPSPA